jgi:ABC-type cobalamin/Fe3+-siderophores transport system ATPase subunit
VISTLKLRFGRASGIAPQDIATTPVTVFVGPNNSGKSVVLREIERYCRTGQHVHDLIFGSATLTPLGAAAASAAIDNLTQTPNPGEAVQVDHVLIGSRFGRLQIQRPQLLQVLQNPASNPVGLCQWFLNLSTLRLDGQSRIGLMVTQPAGDLQRAPQNSLQVLFRDDTKRREVRRIVADAFGTFFVIDPTNLGHLRARLSAREPRDGMEERGIHEEAVRFHANATPIDEASDGVKAFTGIIVELIAGDPRVLLIDEPEAFLHPSLASKLGFEVARAAQSADKRVFVSTHSPNFVMGCIQSGAHTNIVRLTYREGVATARLLPSSEILELMRNPLLRSTNVINGLFYEFVVVTESDADRAFYQEINERLLQHKPEWGIPNCLFINAQNKQTEQTIIRPLRQLGIPAASVVDVDVLKEGGTVWDRLLEAANVPELTRNSLAVLRASINRAMGASGKDMKRDGGVDILKPEDKEAALGLFKHLREYGVFVVPGGELESWLKPLGAAGHGPAWLIGIFEKIGQDPAAANYLKPSGDDVWAFLANIKVWLTDANRKGIPS